LSLNGGPAAVWPGPSVDPLRVGRVRAAAQRVLAGNWRQGRLSDGTPYGFTCPSAPRYRHQWYWDSCFHAIVWRHFQPARAREELRTLVRGGRLDGFVPHTIFWHDRPGWRRAPFYATDSIRGNRATAHTMTPVLAMAWELVAECSPDAPEFVAEGLDALRLHYDWLEHHRDPDGNGLISIIHPDESGLDDSPKYDATFGWMSHHQPGYYWLVQRSRRLRYDSRAIMSRYPEHVEDVLVNVFYALSLRALARMSGDDAYRQRAERTEQALLEHCWDEERGLFWDLDGPEHRPLRVSTWSSLAPLALPSLPEPIARRVIEEHLLDPRRYRAPYGIPSVAMNEPSFRPGWHRFRCWRGPSWINTAWLLVPALYRHGYVADAERILLACLELVEREGFREYYNPLTGQGLGARNFGWSTLLVDLLPGAPEDLGVGDGSPYLGSMPGELWAMGSEALSELRRGFGGRASRSARGRVSRGRD
jgi:glycogen debranching enzyme